MEMYIFIGVLVRVPPGAGAEAASVKDQPGGVPPVPPATELQLPSLTFNK